MDACGRLADTPLRYRAAVGHFPFALQLLDDTRLCVYLISCECPRVLHAVSS